jgi:cobalt-zinc-cadmium efflux system membrane fusion protein
VKRTILVPCAILLAACSRPPAPPSNAEAAPPTPAASAREVVLDAAAQRDAGIEVRTVEVRSVPQAIRATGRLALNENATWRVGAVTEGRIVTVIANPGDRVAEGQVLARMHSHEIHESRANYRKAVSELARLQAQESFAVRARDRALRLFELKAASTQQTEAAEAELRNAQTAVANARVEVDRTERHLTEFLGIPADVPDHPPDEPHAEDADLIPIAAPATGTVMARNVTSGTVVAPSGELFLISNLSTLWMIAAVNEENLSRVRAGMPARVFVQAYPNQPFRGRVAKLGDELDPTTRTVKVRVELPNRDGRLKPEMYATAEIEIGGSEPALFVPQAALQEVSGEAVVFVRRSGDRFEVRAVETGRIVEGAQEIARGLKAGDAVVTRGAFLLKSQLLKSALAEED